MLMLPPLAPSRMRKTKTTAMLGANAIPAQLIVAPTWLMISTVLRPTAVRKRFPQIGARDQAGERKRREENTYDERRSTEMGHEIRHQRNQHAESDDVDERDAEDR